jgi:intracellular septation protein
MKLLFDFLPLLCFFGTFRLAEANKEWATRFANDHFGMLVSGGVVGADEAPVLLATLVVIVVTMCQVAWLMVRRQKVDKMLWANLAIVVVLGGLTVWFHDKMFILWKPTMVYWITAASFLISQLVFKKNLLQAVMGAEINLPAQVWQRLNIAWVLFFVAMGFLNLYVAFNYPLDTWVNFKAFGGIGLPLLFILGTGVYLSRHMPPDNADSKA